MRDIDDPLARSDKRCALMSFDAALFTRLIGEYCVQTNAFQIFDYARHHDFDRWLGWEFGF
jgi:hypothetical protein